MHYGLNTACTSIFVHELTPQSLVLIVLGEVELNLGVCFEMGPLRKDYLGLRFRGGTHKIELRWLCKDRESTKKFRYICISAMM